MSVISCLALGVVNGSCIPTKGDVVYPLWQEVLAF